MEENTYKEVRFDLYCKKCRHVKVVEDKEPCCECLNESVILYSHKPVRFDEKV